MKGQDERGDEKQATYQFLGNHAAHADAHDVDMALCSPSYVVQELYDVASHFRRIVSEHGLVRFSDSAVVEDEGRICVALFVTEVFGLALPGILHAAQAHDPLHGWHQTSAGANNNNDKACEMNQDGG